MASEHPLVVLKETAHGLGVFAARDLAAETPVLAFSGPVCSLADIRESDIRYPLWLDGDEWMVLESPGRYVNHSCAPNARIVLRSDGVRCLESLRRIPAGEEITFHYDVIWSEEFDRNADDPMFRFWHPDWTFDCLCGSPSCRGRIDGYVVARTGSDGRAGYSKLPEIPVPIGSDPAIALRPIPDKGRGIVTLRDFRPGAVVERAPVIVIPDLQWPAIEATVLYAYCFAWGERLQHAAIALGSGSLYNHSPRPNCRFVRRLDEGVIDFVVCRPIAAGDEITISYKTTYGDDVDLWFEVRE